MATVSDLSPLAFEVLKFLCNANDDTSYQSIGKETFGIESQEDFTHAITELKGENLIFTTEDAAGMPDPDMDAYSKNVISASDNATNNGLVWAKINDTDGDICKDMYYYTEAQRDTNV